MSSTPLDESHEPRSTELFLDTSIHCCWFKGLDITNRLSQVLSLFRWVGTSTYTKLEYGNVVLSQAEYFLRKLRELGSLSRVVSHVGNVLSKQHHSKKVWAFNLLTEHYGEDDAEVTERAELYLQTLMGIGTVFVEKKVDGPLQDGTACYFARRGVAEKRDGMLTWKTPDCKPGKRRCRIDEFFVDNRDLFSAIKQAIDALPEDRKTGQLKDFSNVIEQAMSDPKCLLAYRTGCRRLADAIIAVDGRKYLSMFSQNVNESEVLCKVLGQVFYYLPNEKSKGVRVYDFGKSDAVDPMGEAQ